MLSREGGTVVSSPDGLSELGGGTSSGRKSLGSDRVARSSHGWLEQVVFGIDSILRRCHSIIEYTSDPNCILRIKLGRLDEDIVLSDGSRGGAGARIIDLHLWNEQIPRMPRQGASIAWALQMNACFRFSLEALARYLARRPDFDDIVLIRCNMAFGGPDRNAQMVRLISRYGFELVPAATAVRLAERARRCGENILISLMVWARNSAALRQDTLRRGRTQVFLSRRALEQRYGRGGIGLSRCAAGEDARQGLV
jgi:hypothetical protein